MAEFFVMCKYRRAGVGSEAARLVFAQLPGEWQVRQEESNAAATIFWRGAIPVEFDEARKEGRRVQRFSIGAP
jgi:predicted acetyltransferase